MKKLLFASALLASLAAFPVQATQFWYDAITDYPLGGITTNTPLWWAHPPGSMTATDALVVTNNYTSGAAVSGKRLRINGLNSQYIERWLDPTTGGVTNTFGSGSIYASFVANANYVPSAGAGTYFACFNDGGVPFSPTNGFEFRGRVFQIGNTNAWPYTTRLGLTYSFGIANAAGDPAQGGGSSIMYVPMDLIKNVDYQVVLKYDIDNAVAYLWVNPASESDTANMAGPTSDLGAITNAFAALLFRQRTGGGTVDIRDVVVGTTFADVVTNQTCAPVMVATNYNTVTNYAGNPALLEVFATSIGGGPLSYQWYQISGGSSNAVPGATAQTYLVPSLSGSDAGNYCCVVANSCGMNAASSTNFYLSVNTTATAPGFTTKPPATTGGGVGGSLTLNSAAFGTGPLNYQWSFNGTPLVDGAPVTGNPGDASVVSGAHTPTLKVTMLSTNETGNFTVTVTGGASPAATATTAVTVSLPQPVSIAYIRSLETADNGWQVTDTSSLYTVTGVVTMYTNVVGSGNTSFWIQDATGGIDFFLTQNSSFRPQMGDIVTATGTLSMFNNGLELVANNPANPACKFEQVGHTNVLPAPIVFSLAMTNNPGLMETNVEGRLCMLTNVTFTTSPASGTGNYNTYVQDASGGPAFNVFWPAGTDPDVQNKTLSTRFAYTITGVMAQYVSGAYANRYELYVTRIGDIQTNPPPPVTAAATVSGNNVVLTWPAVPYTTDTRGAYSYSVLSATDVAGPYLPLALGLAFNTTNGVYTDTNALVGPQKFYRISSP